MVPKYVECLESKRPFPSAPYFSTAHIHALNISSNMFRSTYSALRAKNPILHLRTACDTVSGRRCHAMHVGVIGGTGHISSSIVRVLLAQGHAVTCVNRGLRGAVAPGARLVRGDRRARAAFERTLQAERFDAVIDMLCFTRADALSSLRAYRDVSHVVQCSTVCTYGITYDWLPVTEDHPLRPITPYGQHKAAADATLLAAYECAGFPVTILKRSEERRV